ncbi:MAG: ScpA family protein [Pseudomonadota bacterium]
MSADLIAIDALSAAAEDAEATDAFVVDVGAYEGPLHLLLELARRQKVDLLKVAMLPLAEQYLAFIEDAREKRIDLAADYLLMAAWLAFLKSRLMLPTPQKVAEDELSGEDMAAQLAFRLKRLDAMRVAADELFGGPILGERVFLNGQPEQPKIVKHTEFDTTLYHLTQAFGAIRGRRRQAEPHRIEQQFVLPLEAARDRLRAITPALHEWASLATIRDGILLDDDDVPERSVTASVFSATLELVRDGDVVVRQDAHFGPLYLRGAIPPPEEAANDSA